MTDTAKKRIINKIKVTNMRNGRGREVVNQFEITTPEGVYFQSYKSLIAFIPSDSSKVYLDKTYWDYSRTTGKYRNQFLREGIKETRGKIKAGLYELVELN